MSINPRAAEESTTSRCCTWPQSAHMYTSIGNRCSALAASRSVEYFSDNGIGSSLRTSRTSAAPQSRHVVLWETAVIKRSLRPPICSKRSSTRSSSRCGAIPLSLVVLVMLSPLYFGLKGTATPFATAVVGLIIVAGAFSLRARARARSTYVMLAAPERCRLPVIRFSPRAEKQLSGKFG